MAYNEHIPGQKELTTTTRKTTTSSEVKARWMKANYKTYRVNLRYDCDQPIIDYIEARKTQDGVTPVIREALENLIKK